MTGGFREALEAQVVDAMGAMGATDTADAR